jgi:hypothetical protein
MSRHGNSATVTIASGAALTAALNLDTLSGVAQDDSVVSQKLGMRLGGIIMPSAWTAANLTFQVSADGTNFFDLHDKYDNEIAVTVAASSGYLLDLADWMTFPYLKIRSGTAAAPVNQAATRNLVLLLRATGV